VPVNEHDGWLSLGDPHDYGYMACRWLVILDHAGRAPAARQIT